MRCFRGGSRRWRYRAAKRFRRQAKVGSGMIACSREATSWRNRRQVPAGSGGQGQALGPAGRVLEFVDERLEQKDD